MMMQSTHPLSVHTKLGYLRFTHVSLPCYKDYIWNNGFMDTIKCYGKPQGFDIE